MERLKGRTILIGKEPEKGRLNVAIEVNGQQKVASIGESGSVPNTVSRCKPAEGVAHCKIVVDDSGAMTITNLKPQNVTFVNGTEVQSKRIDTSSKIALGINRYELSLSDVLDAAFKIVSVGMPAGAQGKAPAKPLSIKHLEKVWDTYHQRTLAIKKRQKDIALLSRIPMFFTLGAGALAGIAASCGWPEWVKIVTVSMTVLGILLMAFGFYKSATDKSIEEGEEALEELQKHYVCPNPACHHYMGTQSYKILKQTKKCPYCGCPLTSD